MKRPLFLFAAALALTACRPPPQNTVPTHEHAQAPSPALTAAALPTALSATERPLVATYSAAKYVVPRGVRIREQVIEGLRYAPRQFAPGFAVDTMATPDFGRQVIQDAASYAGWDTLSLSNIYTESRQTAQDYVQISLNRAATLAVVWRPRTTRPAWLADWTPGGNVTVTGLGKEGTVTSYPVFRKPFPAGEVDLGGAELVRPASTQNYFLLIGEADGTASTPPTVPAGRETPVPNTTCPAWVHDQYVAPGPDGKMYPTWHPEIDPVYWCYFGHEHGSDPSLAGVAPNGKPVFQPLYGYTAAQHGMTEPHAGFKTHLIRSPGTDDWWFWTVHMGSSGLKRVCENMHTVDTAVVTNGVIRADLHAMGDFGRPRYVNQQDAVSPKPITGCTAEQLSVTAHGGRSIVTDSSGYEAWTLASEPAATGLKSRFISFKTSFPATDCANPPLCTQLRPSLHGDVGTVRTIQYTGQIPNTTTPSGPGPSLIAGASTGVFYTDVTGQTVVTPGSPMSVRQYVEPGLNVQMQPPFETHCGPHDGWTQEYRCDLPLIRVTYNIERAVRFGN